jgi:DNA-binding CsgD family transcriptional regulator
MQYRYFEEVSESPDLLSFMKGLTAIAAELDFGLIGALLLTERIDKSRRFMMVHNAPPAFAEDATRNGDDARRDPVLQRLKRNGLPFAYRQADYVDAGAGDLWEQQAAYGYSNGIAVALHVPGGRRFMLGFDRHEPLPGSDEKMGRLLADLQLAATHAQSAAVRLFNKSELQPERPNLTRRELEVLTWAAAGKTAGETAQILEVSTWTVTYYMRRVLEKLHAVNKQTAVANALALGLI